MSRMLRIKEVIKATGLSKTTIHRRANDPTDDFPAALRLGPGAVGWLESELTEWLESRARVVAA